MPFFHGNLVTLHPHSHVFKGSCFSTCTCYTLGLLKADISRGVQWCHIMVESIFMCLPATSPMEEVALSPSPTSN